MRQSLQPCCPIIFPVRNADAPSPFFMLRFLSVPPPAFFSVALLSTPSAGARRSTRLASPASRCPYLRYVFPILLAARPRICHPLPLGEGAKREPVRAKPQEKVRASVFEPPCRSCSPTSPTPAPSSAMPLTRSLSAASPSSCRHISNASAASIFPAPISSSAALPFFRA